MRKLIKVYYVVLDPGGVRRGSDHATKEEADRAATYWRQYALTMENPHPNYRAVKVSRYRGSAEKELQALRSEVERLKANQKPERHVYSPGITSDACNCGLCET